VNSSRLLAAVALSAAGFAAIAGAAASGPSAKPKGKPAVGYRLQTLGHADPGGLSADVYGHRGHAYLSSFRTSSCGGEGVRIYNLGNPRTPRLVGTFADRNSDPAVAGADSQKTIVQRVQTPRFTGDLAVTGFQRCGRSGFQGFGLYDVSNPAQPKKLALVPTEPRGVHEVWLQRKGERAYVYVAIPSSELLSSPDYDVESGTAKTPGRPDFRIYEVTDPSRPVEVGAWGAWASIGISPRDGRGISKVNLVHSVITNAAATRAYLSYWDLGTVILDISEPTTPRYLGRTSFRGSEQGDAHSVALGNAGKLLIQTHESPRASHPVLYDISNERSPRRISEFRLPGTAPESGSSFLNGVHDAKVVGNRAIFSWYRHGVIVADISKPAKPRLLARFVPPNSPQPQVWGVDVEGDSILASDMDSGLWVLRLARRSA